MRLQPLLQFSTSIMKHLIDGIAVGIQFPGNFIHRNIVEDHHKKDTALPIRQIMVNDLLDDLPNLALHGGLIWLAFGIFQTPFKRRAILRRKQLVDRYAFAALPASSHQSHVDGELIGPGGEFAVASEVREVIHHGNQGILGAILGKLQSFCTGQGFKITRVATEEKQDGPQQKISQVRNGRFLYLATGIQIVQPLLVCARACHGSHYIQKAICLSWLVTDQPFEIGPFREVQCDGVIGCL